MYSPQLAGILTRQPAAVCIAVSLLLFAPPLESQASGSGIATDRDAEIRELRAAVRQLQQRVERLESERTNNNVAASAVDQPTDPPTDKEISVAQKSSTSDAASALTAEDRGILNYLRGTTINFAIDGYYGYNFNHPIGRVNALRAYDVLSNNISLNQANVIFERAPDVEAGRRYGARLDLQFGQATDTLQGNPLNEPRPQIYRNIFQAYGRISFPWEVD